MNRLNRVLPGRDPAGDIPHGYTTLDGQVRLHLDIDEEEYWIDAVRGYDPDSLCQVLTQADWWGLEPLDEEECPAQLVALKGGKVAVRIHLAAKTGVPL